CKSGMREAGPISPGSKPITDQSGSGAPGSGILLAGAGERSAGGRGVNAVFAAPTAHLAPSSWAGAGPRTSRPDRMVQPSDHWAGIAATPSTTPEPRTVSPARPSSTDPSAASWHALA